MKRLALLSFSAAFLVGCSDLPTQVDGSGSEDFAIFDGRHADPIDGHFGNPSFFFLDKIVPKPKGKGKTKFEPHKFEKFNDDLRPTLAVCEPSDCTVTLATFETEDQSQGKGKKKTKGDTEEIKIKKNHFELNLDTRDFGFAVGDIFRVYVLIGFTSLGYVDVVVVDNKKDIGPITGADPQEFGAVEQDKKLKIKFFIGVGALCDPLAEQCASAPIGAEEGGTVETEAGDNIVIPPLPPGTKYEVVDPEDPAGTIEVDVITVTMQECEEALFLELDLPLFSGCYSVTTDPPLAPGFEFDNRPTVSFCSLGGPGLLPPVFGLTESQLQQLTVHKLGDTGEILALPHVEDNCEEDPLLASDGPGGILRLARMGWRALRNGAVSLVGGEPLAANRSRRFFNFGPAGGPPNFSSFQVGLPAQMAYVDEDDASRTAEAGSALPTAVRVHDLDDEPVSGASITFTVTVGGGIVGSTTKTVVTGASGIAEVTWTIAGGDNRVVASGRGIAGPDDPGPFIPEIFDGEGGAVPPDEQEPVLGETGEAPFDALGTDPGIIVAGIGANLGNVITNTIFSSGDLSGSIIRLSVSDFNQLTVADLIGSYDVLLITWDSDESLNVDWNTRLLPFLMLGGGVIFDGDPNNIGDLSAVITTSLLDLSGEDPSGISVSATVPGLTDGIHDLFDNNHIRFASFSDFNPMFSPFLTLTRSSVTYVIGLHAPVGTGCVLVTGPDQDFHGIRGVGGTSGNQYNLLVNELRFVTDASLCN